MLIEFFASIIMTGLVSISNTNKVDQYRKQMHEEYGVEEIPFWAKPDSGVNSFRNMSSKEMKEWLHK